MPKGEKAKCSGECRYEKQWVDNLHGFETWTIHWFTREITIARGVSGPGRDALRNHAESMRIGRWTKSCPRIAGCHCDGQWRNLPTTRLALRMGDGVYGAIALCWADLHRQEYVGTCKHE